MRLLILLCLMLSACGRPLSGPEGDFAARLFGPSLDIAPVRLVRNGFVGMAERRFATRPRTTCRERLLPPAEGPVETGRIAGVVLGNTVHLRPGIHRPDFTRDADGALTLGAAMFLAHELTHIWQGQNRAVTGYSPWRVGAEHRPGMDPYLFDPAANPAFLDFGFEQQASLVEEYVCCVALDPDGARTDRLRSLLTPHFDLGALPAGPVRVPWDGVQRTGICR